MEFGVEAAVIFLMAFELCIVILCRHCMIPMMIIYKRKISATRHSSLNEILCSMLSWPTKAISYLSDIVVFPLRSRRPTMTQCGSLAGLVANADSLHLMVRIGPIVKRRTKWTRRMLAKRYLDHLLCL